MRSLPCPILLSLLLAVPACGKKIKTGAPPDAAAAAEAKAPGEQDAPVADDSQGSTTDSSPSAQGSAASVDEYLRDAQKRLQAGEFDTAAAQLLRIQVEGGQFNSQHAAAYREALGEAMTAAMAAAEKGDPRALAALQMLRSTRRR